MNKYLIIFISGSINSGKSTVAKILSQKIPNAAIVEIDLFHSFIEWKPINESIEINLENASSVIKNFARRGFNVIVPYPLSQKNHDYFNNELKNLDAEIQFFTLNPTLETALSNRDGRKLSDWEKKRIAYHYEIGINQPSFGEVIDNSQQTPEETANQIINNL